MSAGRSEPNCDASLAVRGFTHTTLAARVVFGAGVLDDLPREIELLGLRRLLLLSTPGQRGLAERTGVVLQSKCAGIFSGAVTHVPVECAQQAVSAARAAGADGLVALGGGSTIGVAKAIALQTNLPIVAVPTTYAGSEMTPIYGLTEAGVKRTGRDTRVLPRTVLYDPLLSQHLPARTSAASGMNAIAHAVEGLYGEDTNPIAQMLAEAAIRALAPGLRVVIDTLDDLPARCRCLYGGWLCGLVLGSVSMGLHHKLCHTLGGSFNLPHAETHSILLTHVAAYNTPAAPAAMRCVAAALGTEDAAQGLFDLVRQLGLPLSLRDLGMRETDLDLAAELATRAAYANPRPVTRAAIRLLLDDAFFGRAPRRE